MQSQLNNRRIETNGFLEGLESERPSDRPTLESAELVFADFEILEGLGKQFGYSAAHPCLTFDK